MADTDNKGGKVAQGTANAGDRHNDPANVDPNKTRTASQPRGGMLMSSNLYRDKPGRVPAIGRVVSYDDGQPMSRTRRHEIEEQQRMERFYANGRKNHDEVQAQWDRRRDAQRSAWQEAGTKVRQRQRDIVVANQSIQQGDFTNLTRISQDNWDNMGVGSPTRKTDWAVDDKGQFLKGADGQPYRQDSFVKEGAVDLGKNSDLIARINDWRQNQWSTNFRNGVSYSRYDGGFDRSSLPSGIFKDDGTLDTSKITSQKQLDALAHIMDADQKKVSSDYARYNNGRRQKVAGSAAERAEMESAAQRQELLRHGYDIDDIHNLSPEDLAASVKSVRYVAASKALEGFDTAKGRGGHTAKDRTEAATRLRGLGYSTSEIYRIIDGDRHRFKEDMARANGRDSIMMRDMDRAGRKLEDQIRPNDPLGDAQRAVGKDALEFQNGYDPRNNPASDPYDMARSKAPDTTDKSIEEARRDIEENAAKRHEQPDVQVDNVFEDDYDGPLTYEQAKAANADAEAAAKVARREALKAQTDAGIVYRNGEPFYQTPTGDWVPVTNDKSELYPEHNVALDAAAAVEAAQDRANHTGHIKNDFENERAYERADELEAAGQIEQARRIREATTQRIYDGEYRGSDDRIAEGGSTAAGRALHRLQRNAAALALGVNPDTGEANLFLGKPRGFIDAATNAGAIVAPLASVPATAVGRTLQGLRDQQWETGDFGPETWGNALLDAGKKTAVQVALGSLGSLVKFARPARAATRPAERANRSLTPDVIVPESPIKGQLPAPAVRGVGRVSRSTTPDVIIPEPPVAGYLPAPAVRGVGNANAAVTPEVITPAAEPALQFARGRQAARGYGALAKRMGGYPKPPAPRATQPELPGLDSRLPPPVKARPSSRKSTGRPKATPKAKPRRGSGRTKGGK